LNIDKTAYVHKPCYSQTLSNH